MRSLISILAILAVAVMVGCKGKVEQKAAVAADSTKIVAVDTAKAVVVDTTKKVEVKK